MLRYHPARARHQTVTVLTVTDVVRYLSQFLARQPVEEVLSAILRWLRRLDKYGAGTMPLAIGSPCPAADSGGPASALAADSP